MNETILLVDDTPENLKILSGILKKEGYKLRFAKSGEQALSSFNAAVPDLILMDIMMPEMDGFETCEKIRELPLGREIPIIFLSALSSSEDKVRAFEAGGVDYIEKPFQAIEVLARVRTHIELNKSIQRSIEVSNQMSHAEKLAHLGNWEWNINENKVSWSDELYNIYGVTRENYNPSFENYISKVHEDDQQRVSESISNALENHSSFEFEERIILPSGEIRYLQSWGELILDASNNPKKMFGACLDVTKIKEAEKIKTTFTEELAQKVKERTEELEKMQIQLEEALSKEKELGDLKSRFVSSASHQFRTPLAVIQSNLGLLKLYFEELSPEFNNKIDHISKRINSEVKRMTDMMNEVLILGKIGANGITPKFEYIDIIDKCEEILGNHNQIQSDGREAKLIVSGPPKKINLDSQLFEHSLSNIISNAFKYSKGKPAPLAHIDFKDNDVIIEVEDFGIGIPKEDLPNLFDPFFRASNVVDIPGSGLGTSILKEYVESINGTIKVESDLNKGTKITLKFNNQN